MRLMRAEEQLEEAAEQIWQIHRSRRKNRGGLRKQALNKPAATRKQQEVAGGAI
jgi:hypothetical protein